MNTPTSATITSSSGKLSQPSACRSGIETRSGTRARSESTIVRRAPSRETTVPDGIPRTATGTSSAARTTPILVAEPVVESTNQGRARNVIREPSEETISAATSATIGR